MFVIARHFKATTWGPLRCFDTVTITVNYQGNQLCYSIKSTSSLPMGFPDWLSPLKTDNKRSIPPLAWTRSVWSHWVTANFFYYAHLKCFPTVYDMPITTTVACKKLDPLFFLNNSLNIHHRTPKPLAMGFYWPVWHFNFFDLFALFSTLTYLERHGSQEIISPE